MSIITVPFSWLLTQLYDLCGNIGVAVILFALVVNLILTPFMAKSKKSMMRQTRLQPRMKELEKRHAGNPQKYQQEVSKLMKEEGVNPMSGCLWSLLPFPILIALYSVIRKPLTVMMGLGEEAVTLIQTTLENMGLLTSAADMTARQQQYLEVTMAQLSHEHFSELSGLVEGLKDISYDFLGLNLGANPQLFFWNTEGFGTGDWWPVFGLFLVPFVSALVSWLSIKVSMAANPPASGPQAQQMESTNKMIQLMMPIMSLWIGFSMPGAMGVYWIANSLFNMIRDFILTKHYRKKLYEDDEEWLARERKREQEEAELERKREAAERRKATGEILENKNISKKKLQAAEKQKAEEMKAAAIAAERAVRREKLGIEEKEIPASQVGNRRYARGRAYDPNRFGSQGEVFMEPEEPGTEETQESTL